MYRKLAKSFWGFLIGLTALTLVAGSSYAITLQSWDKKIDNAAWRFRVLNQFNDEAVLDRETGLVWERSPTYPDQQQWWGAFGFCYAKILGDRMGWRLPTLEELSSLVDPTQSDPALPVGHPFTNVGAIYWTANTDIKIPSFSVALGFGNGTIFSFTRSNTLFVWCVRGGKGIDVGH